MLGKLIKHEFRATGRLMLPLMLLLVALALFNCVLIPTIMRSDKDNLVALCIIFVTGIVIACVGIAAAAVLILISRFRSHVLGNEGYTTMTLPVSVDEIIWSKLIVSSIWYLAFCVIAAASVYINFKGAELLTGLRDFFASRLWEWKGTMAPVVVIDYRIRVFADMLLSFLRWCLRVYASLTLGNMFRSGKLLISVLIYAAFSVLSMIGTFISTVLIEGVRSGFSETVSLSADSGWFGVLQILISAVILYLITSFALRKNPNLE